MKKVLFAMLYAVVTCFGIANAGTLTQNFVADDGKVFVVETALTVEKVAGAVNVTASNGTTYAFADATGALYTKVLNSAGFGTHFIQVPSTLQHVNTTAPMYIMCFSGNTYFAYSNLPGRSFNDGCALVNAIKAASN